MVIDDRGTRSLGASLSQVPWMKFRVIAEPNMDLFASDIRLRSFISEVTKLTVSMVTKECSEEIAVLVTTLMASLSNSMTTRVSLLQETIIEQIAALKLADTMTGCHTLHGIEDRFCVGPIRQREPIHTPVESPKHVQGEHDHGTHGLSLYLHDHHLDISKANWIWTNEAAHRKPGHPLLARPFRKVIKTEWAVNRLSITMACDNRYTLYVNGHLVGSGEVWKTPDRYTVEFEATTEVVVAVYAASEDITGTAVGLIACGKVWNTHEQHAREILFVSDGSWKTHSSSNLEKTFFHAHFKDSTWEQAYVVATYGGAAWSSEMKGAHKGKLVHKRWTGRSNIPDAPESPKAKVIA